MERANSFIRANPPPSPPPPSPPPQPLPPPSPPPSPPHHIERETQALPIPPDNLRRDEVIQEEPFDKVEYELAKTIVSSSFSAAIALVVLEHQTQLYLLPFYHLSFALWVAFSASLAGILLFPRFPIVSTVLVRLGIVSAAITFSLLRAMLLPTFFKWVAWLFCVGASFWFLWTLYKQIHGLTDANCSANMVNPLVRMVSLENEPFAMENDVGEEV